MLKASVAADHADQAAEDRLAAVLRRRQEQEDDKVASTHLRRNGLPTRVLIDKVRGRWSSGPGGVDRQPGSSSGIIGGDWQNDFESTKASQFEMVFQAFLSQRTP